MGGGLNKFNTFGGFICFYIANDALLSDSKPLILNGQWIKVLLVKKKRKKKKLYSGDHNFILLKYIWMLNKNKYLNLMTDNVISLWKTFDLHSAAIKNVLFPRCSIT